MTGLETTEHGALSAVVNHEHDRHQSANETIRYAEVIEARLALARDNTRVTMPR